MRTTVRIHRAQGIAGTDPPAVDVYIEDIIASRDKTIAEVDAVFAEDAQALLDALLTSLPQGTVDRLLCKLLEAKASHYVVAARSPL